MLSRRTLLAGTAALAAAACSSPGSATSLPTRRKEGELIWASLSFADLRISTGFMGRVHNAIQQVTAALMEDTENPNGPAKGGYTLRSGFAHPEQVSPRPRNEAELLAWYQSLDADLFTVNPYLARWLGEQGVLLPLDQLIAADEAALIQGHYPYLVDQFRSAGGLFALPVDANPSMVHYDPKYFAEQGVPPVDDSWGWDDIVENAVTLTRRNASGEVQRWGLFTQESGYWWALWQNEAELADPAALNCRLQDAAAREALQFCRDLLHTHRVAPPVTKVIEWQVSETPSRLWPAMLYLPHQSFSRDGYRWAALPRGKVRSVPVAGNLGIAIAARAQNTAQAYTALKGLVDVMQPLALVPARRDAVARLGDFEKNLLPAEIAAIQQSLEHGRGLPPYPLMWDAMRAIEEGLARGDEVATVVNAACSVLTE